MGLLLDPTLVSVTGPFLLSEKTSVGCGCDRAMAWKVWGCQLAWRKHTDGQSHQRGHSTLTSNPLLPTGSFRFFSL